MKKISFLLIESQNSQNYLETEDKNVEVISPNAFDGPNSIALGQRSFSVFVLISTFSATARNPSLAQNIPRMDAWILQTTPSRPVDAKLRNSVGTVLPSDPRTLDQMSPFFTLIMPSPIMVHLTTSI
jgi:hypothetical protein